jgi:hypothetical protein
MAIKGKGQMTTYFLIPEDDAKDKLPGIIDEVMTVPPASPGTRWAEIARRTGSGAGGSMGIPLSSPMPPHGVDMRRSGNSNKTRLCSSSASSRHHRRRTLPAGSCNAVADSSLSNGESTLIAELRADTLDETVGISTSTSNYILMHDEGKCSVGRKRGTYHCCCII